MSQKFPNATLLPLSGQMPISAIKNPPSTNPLDAAASKQWATDYAQAWAYQENQNAAIAWLNGEWARFLINYNRSADLSGMPKPPNSVQASIDLTSDAPINTIETLPCAQYVPVCPFPTFTPLVLAPNSGVL